jgi:hypothetical protein
MTNANELEIIRYELKIITNVLISAFAANVDDEIKDSLFRAALDRAIRVYAQCLKRADAI